MDGPKFFPLGDAALTVEFGNSISVDLNRLSIALADEVSRAPFFGFIEAVPAYASTSIYFDIVTVRRAFPEYDDAFSAVRSVTERVLETVSISGKEDRRTVEIPVRFDTDCGPDLEIVARYSDLSVDSVIDIFTSGLYRVFMFGFLPGFSYMGEVDEHIATPRKETPRQKVAKGSVGIAGKQTGIYSLESPGGWQIMGRTDVELFTPNNEQPSLLGPGDQVRFVSVK